MDPTGYVDAVQRHFAAAAEAGGDDARDLAQRLFGPLGAAVRLTIQDALAAAAEEISVELAPGSVEARLRSGQIEFVVVPPPTTEPDDGGDPVEVPEIGDDGAISRVNVRMPERLKARVDEAAALEGVSLNTWLVRAAAAAAERSGSARPGRRPQRSSQRYTGWSR